MLDSAAKVGRNCSILAADQVLIMKQLVTLFATEDTISLDWHIDKTLIADELGRRLGKKLIKRKKGCLCVFE